jgi:hypothetical protein
MQGVVFQHRLQDLPAKPECSREVADHGRHICADVASDLQAFGISLAVLGNARHQPHSLRLRSRKRARFKQRQRAGLRPDCAWYEIGERHSRVESEIGEGDLEPRRGLGHADVAKASPDRRNANTGAVEGFWRSQRFCAKSLSRQLDAPQT